MHPFSRTIAIESDAPAKPALGAACNGCGVCCLWEPCPLGVVLSRSRTGACKALRWDAVSARYQCGALVDPRAVLRQALPRPLHVLVPFLQPVLRHGAARWIAAGVGCDSTLEAQFPQAPVPPTPVAMRDNPLP